METKLWPAIESDRNVDQYIFQQDGAASHCSNACPSFPDGKFQERIISRRTERVWPAHSPDLSPLNFWLWGELQQTVYDKKPATVKGLRRIVNKAARTISEETVRKAAASFLRRVEKCALKEGGHFEDEI